MFRPARPGRSRHRRFQLASIPASAGAGKAGSGGGRDGRPGDGGGPETHASLRASVPKVSCRSPLPAVASHTETVRELSKPGQSLAPNAATGTTNNPAWWIDGGATPSHDACTGFWKRHRKCRSSHLLFTSHRPTLGATLRVREGSARVMVTSASTSSHWRYYVKKALLGLAAISTLVVATFPAAAFGQADEEPSAPLTLTAATEKISDLSDSDGDQLDVVQVDRDSTEQTVVALTSDGDPVLIRSLFESAKSEDILTEDPMTEDQLIDAGYTTDGDAQHDQEKAFLSDLPQIDPGEVRLSQTTATSQTSFSFALADKSSEYAVYRGDDLIGKTVGGAFTDDGLSPGRNDAYTVTSTSPGPVGDQLTYAVTTLASDATEEVEKSSDPIQALSIAPSAQWFLYDTFITDQYVPIDLFTVAGGQCEGSIGDKYSGDFRSYRTPALFEHPWDNRSVRTGAMAKADFTPSGAYVLKDKTVGTTRLYSSSNVLKESRTASTSGIQFLEESASASLYRFRVSHLVRNPFCSQGAIRYEAYVNIWSSGVMQVNGYRHPVPHHESYGLFTYSNGAQAWIQMYRGSNQSFACLGGICATQTISKTYTP